jgi:UDP-glucose 4-epimerase
MKALITGGAGFVGTNLIKRLLSDGHEVVSLDNYSTGLRENEQEGCIYHNIDLTKTSVEYLSWIEPDIIYHISARARIQPSIDNPHKTFMCNTFGTENVLEYARSEDIPVVYAGSSSVHGDVHANPYTFTKWQGEELCKLYNKVFDLPTVICRFYNVYGEYQLTDGDYCCVLGIFEKQYKSFKPLTITGDGEQRRDFTQVGDVVDGLVRCGEALLDNLMDGVSGQIFELGNGENYSINEVADAFGDYPRKYIDARQGEMRETLNTDNKAQDILGWKPKGDIIKFIKESYFK